MRRRVTPPNNFCLLATTPFVLHLNIFGFHTGNLNVCVYRRSVLRFLLQPFLGSAACFSTQQQRCAGWATDWCFPLLHGLDVCHPLDVASPAPPWNCYDRYEMLVYRVGEILGFYLPLGVRNISSRFLGRYFTFCFANAAPFSARSRESARNMRYRGRKRA